MGSDVLGFETQFVFADAFSVTSEGGEKVILSELEEHSVDPVRADRCIDGGAGISKNPLDGRCKGPDGVYEGVVVVILGDRDVLFVIFLVLKCPGDSLGFCEVGIVEV